MSKTSRPAKHFERLYRANPDPWGLGTSLYEQQKYAATLAALGTRHFQSALEVGCSIGILTSRLASRCDQLVALDFAPSAVKAARARCAPYPGVRIEQMQVPRQWPEGSFDLILFSEVLYFLDESDLLETCALALLHCCRGAWYFWSTTPKRRMIRSAGIQPPLSLSKQRLQPCNLSIKPVSHITGSTCLGSGASRFLAVQHPI